jgi:adenosylhomocysteine nucleosidase
VKTTIGIIAALPREVEGLFDRLDVLDTETTGGYKVSRGRYKDKEIVVLVSGVGMKKARNATAHLIHRHRPDLVLSAGFAGGLYPSLSLGDAVIPPVIVDQSGARIDVPQDLHAKLLQAHPGAISGSILTTPRFIPDQSEKNDLFRRHNALAVDMESMAVAGEASAHGVPHLALRVISDTADQTLPPLSGFLDAQGEIIPMRAFLFFTRHPRRLIPALRFFVGMSRAADSLTALLVTAVSALP